MALEYGLASASTRRVSWAAEQARQAVVRLATRAENGTAATPTRWPPAGSFPSGGDVVPLGFLLQVLNHHTSVDSIFRDVDVRKRLTSLLQSRRQGLLWPYQVGGRVSSTATALVLRGLRDPEAVKALEAFADGEGGYYPWPLTDEVLGDTGPGGTAGRHQADFATTCLIRALRNDAGLETKTGVAYLASRFESRSGLYFANPYVVDWALAWALQGVALATPLRERLATDILASVNEDGSSGRYDVPVSTALAILALTSLGVGGAAVRRSRLRLANLMMPDGTWPSSIPFYSTVKIPQERLPAGMFARLMFGKRQGQFLWLEDKVHAVSLYVDGYRMISSALAYLALTPSGHCAESDFTALPRQRRESCHPRYRCADHIQYIADYALPPYLVPR